MKQRVRMLRTIYGRDDDEFTPRNFMAGQEYIVGPMLLACLIDLGAVELVLETKPEPAPRRRK